MSEETAALCSDCNKSTQKIYGINYQCADCYIKDLEDELQGRTDYSSQAIGTLEQSVEHYKAQLEDQDDLLGYKTAFKLLVDELIKSNDI